MITVKKFIEQQEETEWDLENPHLSNLQDNELVLIDDVPYVKTQVVFLGSQNPQKVAKIEELEIENMRLQLEVEHLLLEYEKAFIKNDALQNLVYNLQRNTEILKEKKRKLHENEELHSKIKKEKEEKEELSKKVKEMNEEIIVLRTAKREALLDAKMSKAILLMQEDNDEKEKEDDKITKKMIHDMESLQAQNKNLKLKNNKLRHAAQFFGQVDSTVQKLNAQIQKAKNSFDLSNVDSEEL